MFGLIPADFLKFYLTSQNSDQHQDKYEYNQTNYRNKEILHILILPKSLKVFSFVSQMILDYYAKPLTNSTKFIKDEEFAKANKLGMWAMMFQYPWDFRKAS